MCACAQILNLDIILSKFNFQNLSFFTYKNVFIKIYENNTKIMWYYWCVYFVLEYIEEKEEKTKYFFFIHIGGYVMKTIKRVAVGAAVFFAFVTVGYSVNTSNVIAKDQMSFSAGSLGNKKNFQNQIIAEAPDLTINAGMAKGTVVQSKPKIEYEGFKFNKGYMVQADSYSEGVEVVAGDSDLLVTIYYTISDSLSFSAGRLKSGNLRIWESDGDLHEEVPSSVKYQEASVYTYRVNSNDSIWLGSSYNSLVLLGVSSEIAEPIEEDEPVSTAVTKSVLNKHLEASTLTGDFSNHQERCTNEELGYYFEPYNEGNIYKYSGTTTAEYADYIIVEPTNSGIQFYVSSEDTTVTFEIGDYSYLGLSSFGLINTETGEFLAPENKDLTRKLFSSKEIYYTSSKTTVTYNINEVGTYALVFPSTFGSRGGKIYSIDVNLGLEATLEEKVVDDNDGTVMFIGSIKGMAGSSINYDLASGYFDIDISNYCELTSRVKRVYEQSDMYSCDRIANVYYVLGNIAGLYGIEGIPGETITVSLTLNLADGTMITVGSVAAVVPEVQ